jgi:hypothetical protein
MGRPDRSGRHAKGYAGKLEENLLTAMSQRTREAYSRGSGSELTSKMLALHSSSALVVNFFEYWSDIDNAPLSEALELPGPILSIDFESQRPTGLPGNPPNLDVCLALPDGYVLAIESKFGEWLTRKSPSALPFKAKYFEKAGGAWESLGLPMCQGLANAMRGNQEQFEYLDAPQLLKHALGMATSVGDNFSLCYLYYEWDAPQAKTHREELARFANLVDPSLRFRSLTYQDLAARLDQACVGRHNSYIQYLRARYVRD